MKTLEELGNAREGAIKEMGLRLGKRRGTVRVAMGDSGLAAGARNTLTSIWEAMKKNGIDDVALLPCAECTPPDGTAPMVAVELEGLPTVKYARVDAAGAELIVTQHLAGGKPVEQLILN